ncbi:hypothetical protein [Aporhodopirellula aestuarii]|uniref:Secreted protein n=1 Tax=Aporhodopirellula aestuarii TaxID=2950107 RepID=A0ABT0TWL3_9BACT|nr:hypothetical protein [Aporhodopirellula aestuarii]MCM2369022.1 hypothetical protein [Aporhodopirellula aestuarii]
MLLRFLICVFLFAPFTIGCSGSSENRVIDTSERRRLTPEEKAERMGAMDSEATDISEAEDSE